jgi:hypothetical protein
LEFCISSAVFPKKRYIFSSPFFFILCSGNEGVGGFSLTVAASLKSLHYLSYPVPGILRDRYFIISISLLSVFMIAWSVSDARTEGESDRVLGIAFDVRETENGFVFSVETSDGSLFKCFYEKCPDDLGVYFFYGDFSKDNELIFLKNMILAEHE